MGGYQWHSLWFVNVDHHVPHWTHLNGIQFPHSVAMAPGYDFLAPFWLQVAHPLAYAAAALSPKSVGKKHTTLGGVHGDGSHENPIKKTPGFSGIDMVHTWDSCAPGPLQGFLGSSRLPAQALPNMPDEIKEDDLLATWIRVARVSMSSGWCWSIVHCTYLI